MARARGGEAGQALVFTAVFTTFLLIVGLFAVNVGVLVASRLSAQRAADAAALAGCAELPDQEDAAAMADRYGSDYNSRPGAHLEGGNATGTRFSSTALTNDTVQVEIARAQTLIGYGALGISAPTVRARATCTRAEGPRPAILALGAGSGRLVVRSGAQLLLGENGAAVNSSAADSLIVEPGALAQGRFFDTGIGRAAVTGAIKPPVTQGVLADPFAGVAAPAPPSPGPNPDDPQTMPGCDYEAEPNVTSPRAPRRCWITGGAASPGAYWGGLELGSRSGSASTVTLSAGVYYLAGAGGGGGGNGGNGAGEAFGLRVNPGTRVQGSGALFFIGFNPTATLAAQRFCGPLVIGDRADLRLAPAAGMGGAELLIVQDRDCPLPAVIGRGARIGEPGARKGVLYLPSAAVSLAGVSAGLPSEIRASLIAESVDVVGSVTFDVFIPSATLWHGRVKLVE